MKKSQDVCTQEEPRTRSCDWRVAKGGTRVKHAGEPKGHTSWSTTVQKFQSDQAVSS